MTENRTVKVALVKSLFEWGDTEANIELLEEIVACLEGAEIDVLITPECFLDGYMVRDKDLCTTEKLASHCVSGPDDPFVERGQRLASRLHSYLVFCASERDRTGTIRNAAYLLGRNGEYIGTFYKVMPNSFYQAGSDLSVFYTDFGQVGIVICADRRWPEHIRCLRLKGADIILVPSWGMFGGLNNLVMQVRSYENGIPICFAHPEQALVCLQDGTIGAVLESNLPGVLLHELDLNNNVEALVNGEKAASHPIQNRRPDLYGALVALE